MKTLHKLLVLFVFALLPGLLGGCNASAPHWQSWTVSEGGLMRDAGRCARVDDALEKLVAPHAPVHIHILDNNSVAAYSYADGHIFVTRGLMDIATDDELAAAIAHELGHLVSDGHLQGAQYRSLVGKDDPEDKEMQADAVGVRLLREAGLPPQAMIGILTKVSATTHMVGVRGAIAHRIGKLRQEIAAAGKV